jgi:pimeloyl-ACP methyl ester carboxylesterase
MPQFDGSLPQEDDRGGILLVMVPGIGMTQADLHEQGLIGAVLERGWPLAIAVVDPGGESYLDGSAAGRLADGILGACRDAGCDRIWLAGISLGCQGILQCVLMRPGLIEGVILVTPYLASTGLIGEVTRTGGLKNWAASQTGVEHPERVLLAWLAATPISRLPRILVGRAMADRFVATANLLAGILPVDQVVSVAGAHDWESWCSLWRLILDRHPFRPFSARLS